MRDRVPAAVTQRVRAVRRRRRAATELRTILDADAFDQQWYEAQTGRRFSSVDDACRDYLQTGRRAGRSPHPLFEPTTADPGAYRTVATDPLVAQLRGKPTRSGRTQPGLAGPTDPIGGTPPWLATATSGGPVDLVWGGTPQPWPELRNRAIEAAVETHRLRELKTAVEPTEVEPPLLAPGSLPAPPPPEAGRRLVSIVMPAWNRARVITQAIASVQAQTLTDWELIVVDDGSDDDTLAVVRAEAAKDPRIRPVAAAHGGVCRARNLAIAEARGRYVAFLDTDNSWRPEFLAAAVGTAHAANAPWVHAVLTMPSDTGVRYRALEGDLEHILVANYIDLNVVVTTREALERIGGFDETMRRAVDYDLVVRLCELAPPRLVPAVGADYTSDLSDEYRISVAEPLAWNYAVALGHLVDLTSAPPRVAGRLSILLPVRAAPVDVVELVSALRGVADDVEVIVVVTGRDEALARSLTVAALGSPDVHVRYWPEDVGWAGSLDLGAARSTGEYLVAWRAECVPSDGWWPPLRAALDEPGVALAQPLLLRPDGLIAAAGGVFVGPDPCPAPLLGGLPVEDAAGLGATSPLPALYGGVFATRFETFAALRGVDPIYGLHLGETDLSLRAHAAGHGEPVVVPHSWVTMGEPGPAGFVGDVSSSVRVLRRRSGAPAGSSAAWARVGFVEQGHRVTTLQTRKGYRAESGLAAVVRPAERAAADLRWAVDVAGEPGSAGWSFAQDVAAALREHGQQVHVDRPAARHRAHRDLDDVILTLRGADVVLARPGAVNLLWVLDDLPVGEPEARGYDQVLATGPTWAAAAAARWGLPVQVLPADPVEDGVRALVEAAQRYHAARTAVR